MRRKTASTTLGRAAIVALLAVTANGQTPTTADTVRFLEQSTFGPTQALISHVQAIGFSAFLDEQFAAAPSTYPPLPLQPTTVPATCTGTCVTQNYTMYPVQITFFMNALTGQDQVRQRVAFALQQIMVTSGLTITQPSWMTPYLNIFAQDAFGTYRNLLGDITLNPAMGSYLNMAGNNKTAPNENYGRESLQLFTVGLNQLHPDGTLVTDKNGNPVPAYAQATVTAFARVFTGWNLAPGISGIPNYTSPMVLTPANHDAGSKVLLNGVTLPAVSPVTSTSAYNDLNSALDNMMADANVAPFISTNLIQHLVTSNPTPAYVARVAAVFNDNGSGVKGDLKAVIKAILLDQEARNPNPNANFGHLTEPVLFITKLLRLFNTTSATTDFVLSDGFLPSELLMGENLFLSPSVFNYFPPAYTVPNTAVNGPEFNLQSTSTAYARVNFVAETVYKTMSTNINRPTGTWLDLTSILPDATSAFKLTSTLDTLMLHGSMSSNLRAALNNALSSMTNPTPTALAQRAVYLIGSSPEYFVER